MNPIESLSACKVSPNPSPQRKAGQRSALSVRLTRAAVQAVFCFHDFLRFADPFGGHPFRDERVYGIGLGMGVLGMGIWV